MLTVVCTDKGSAGATTLAIALTASRPDDLVLMEADPAGGDIAFRVPAADGGPLAPQPGLLSLAAAARADAHPELVASHTQQTAGGWRVVPAHCWAEQAAGITRHWPAVAAAADASATDVVADAGRLSSASPALPLVAPADLVYVVAEPTLAGLVRLRERVRFLTGLPPRPGRARRVAPVLVCPDRHRAKAVDEAMAVLTEAGLSADRITSVVWDPAAAACLWDGADTTGRVGRSLLLRTAAPLAAAAVTTADAGEGVGV